MNGTQDRLVERMLEPHFYDHPVTKVELVETHISRIFLAGDFAYKLKKPVNFGFLDFSTREQRRYYCHEELRLNRRFSPQLYLAVCSVGGPPDEPRLGGEPTGDFLVKMQRFPARAQLDRVLAEGRLSHTQMEAFAQLIAGFHQQAAIAKTETGYGSPTAVIDPVLENFAQLAPILPDESAAKTFRLLENWSRNACEQLRERLQQRKDNDFIRECHGDLHLANMLWWDEQPLLFDCIEFNANLRWIDLLNDIAFLVMDLDDRRETCLGWSFLNTYLQQTGDYQELELFDFYKVYRAMVRAKVACLRLGQPGLAATEKSEDRDLVHSYLALAASYIGPRRPQLLITHGLSGSGKTGYITQLAPLIGAICIHSDSERKRLAGLAMTTDSNSPPDGGIYTATSTAATYQRLQQLAEPMLRAGVTVIVDATFLKEQQRRQMKLLADRIGIPFRILDFPLAEPELRRRIKRRRLLPDQLSEATEEILDLQLSRQEPLTAEERQIALRIDPDSPVDQIAAQLSSP